MVQYLLCGSPGSGKTARVMYEYGRMINEKKYSPERIAIVSFTNAAVDEIKERLQRDYNLTKKQLCNVRTCHSIAFRGVKAKRMLMMDDFKYKDFGKKIGRNLIVGKDTDAHLTTMTDDMALLKYNDLVRNNSTYAMSCPPKISGREIVIFQSLYKKYKNTFKYYDYTDLFQAYIDKNLTEDVDIAIIDEAQDLTTLQWKFVFKAFRNVDIMYMAGDVDQAVYQWHGADVQTFLNLKATIITQNVSYRLPKKMVEYANVYRGLISKKSPLPRIKTVSKIDGEIKYINDINELTIDPNEYTFMLARNRYLLREYITYCNIHYIPYIYDDEPALSSRDKRAITTWLQIQRGEKKINYVDIGLYRRLIPNLASMTEDDIKNSSWETLFKSCWSDEKINYALDLFLHKKENIVPVVEITTIHRTKGREADHVIIMTDTSRASFMSMRLDPDPEHRVFYVGITRTRNKLTIIMPRTNYFYRPLADFTVALRSTSG